ncbi:GNAT family N-acetyltransferase [Micromonospora sp. NPDC049836]|uniref:GNAT family N-acetyltransferase n=1 Tax=Micromonospora sp. NPDC049836 TaxID=3364274 RepID=UPI0037BB623E
MLVGRPDPGEREIVLDGVLVVPAYRFCGIGRRLVEALSSEMDRSGIRSAHSIAELGDVQFLLACGFRLEASRPAALRLDRPAGSGPAVSGERLPPR